MGTTTTERRLHERTEIELDGTITRVAGPALVGAAATVDLSEGGARLTGPAGFVVGDVVRLSIERDDVVVERQGLVVARHPQPGSKKTATLHIAFRTTPGADPLDLRELISPLD